MFDGLARETGARVRFAPHASAKASRSLSVTSFLWRAVVCLRVNFFRRATLRQKVSCSTDHGVDASTWR